MDKHFARILATIMIAAVFLIPLMGCYQGDTSSAQAPTNKPNPSSPPPTNPAPTTPPTESTLPPTEPTLPPTEPAPTETEPTQPDPTDPPQLPPEDPETLVGDLYTKGDLWNMDNTLVSFGPGVAKNGKRAPYSDAFQEDYGHLGGVFIGDDEPVIYLTFDCGYEYKNKTMAILDALAEKNVKAVFFVTGYYAQTNPEIIRRMIAEGHTVGSHSTTHPDMTTLTIDNMIPEITTVHQYVLEHYDYEMSLLRPPQGRFSARTLALAHSLGYKSVLWSVAYVDYDVEDQPEESAALETLLSRAHNGAIYLLHNISTTNVAILGDLIDGLLAKGYTLELLA